MSRISPLMFFSSEKELFGWTYLLKQTQRRYQRYHKNISISSLKRDFKNPRHAFWAHTNRSTMQQKLFKNFLLQEVGASRNNIEKELQKPLPKLKKIYMLNIYREYLLYLQSNASSRFLQTYIIFLDQWVNFFYFKVA